jgi:hypothetical protein
MSRLLVVMTSLLTLAAGAAVFGSEGSARREAPAPIAAPITIERPVQVEARWTTTPVRVASIDGYARLPDVERPRDVNVDLAAAAPARIPLPPARPPGTEWLVQGDRVHLATWCRSAAEARRLCQDMRQRPVRESRARRTRDARTVVDIRRSDIVVTRRASRRLTPALANAAIDRSPNYDLAR